MLWWLSPDILSSKFSANLFNKRMLSISTWWCCLFQLDDVFEYCIHSFAVIQVQHQVWMGAVHHMSGLLPSYHQVLLLSRRLSVQTHHSIRVWPWSKRGRTGEENEREDWGGVQTAVDSLMWHKHGMWVGVVFLLPRSQWRCMLSIVTRRWKKWLKWEPKRDSKNQHLRKSSIQRYCLYLCT